MQAWLRPLEQRPGCSPAPAPAFARATRRQGTPYCLYSVCTLLLFTLLHSTTQVGYPSSVRGLLRRQPGQSGGPCREQTVRWLERGVKMSAESNRREFLKKAGVLTLAAPGVAAAVEACSPVATSAKASTLRVGWAIEPDTINPLTTYSTEGVEVLQLVYDHLIQYGVNLKPEPGLATSWAYSQGGKTITYKLRSTKWHDGKPFTSADAKFTFELIKSMQLSQYAQWVTYLTAAEAPDSTTLVLHFSKPQAFNPGLAMPILPQHVWQGMSASKIQRYTNPH